MVLGVQVKERVGEWKGGRCGGGAKMQVYERERGEISADSERGGSGESASWLG